MALVRAAAVGLSVPKRCADATRQVDRGGNPQLLPWWASPDQATDAATQRHRGVDPHAENGMGSLSAPVVTGL